MIRAMTKGADLQIESFDDIKGLLGYTHIMIYSRSLRRPVVSVVGDTYHQVRFYIAARGDDGRDQTFAIDSSRVDPSA
jgi:hypothetical protein